MKNKRYYVDKFIDKWVYGFTGAVIGWTIPEMIINQAISIDTSDFLIILAISIILALIAIRREIKNERRYVE